MGAPPSQWAEEDLTPAGDEASISLIDAYRGVMAGVGLSGDALEGWLEEWMKLISADVSEMAQGGIGSTIPGSRAAELLVESRLGTAVAAIAGKCGLLHMATVLVMLVIRIGNGACCGLTIAYCIVHRARTFANTYLLHRLAFVGSRPGIDILPCDQSRSTSARHLVHDLFAYMLACCISVKALGKCLTPILVQYWQDYQHLVQHFTIDISTLLLQMACRDAGVHASAVADHPAASTRAQVLQDMAAGSAL